jgi:putative transposase
VLDILVQSRRNARAAKRFFRELRTGLRYKPRRLVTDKLPSCTSAHRETIPETERCRGGRLNNRAENFHQPTRDRERRMRKFKSMKQAQRFLSTNGQVFNHFRCGRHLMRSCHYRNKMVKKMRDLASDLRN